jgi:hypothetical protein
MKITVLIHEDLTVGERELVTKFVETVKQAGGSITVQGVAGGARIRCDSCCNAECGGNWGTGCYCCHFDHRDGEPRVLRTGALPDTWEISPVGLGDADVDPPAISYGWGGRIAMRLFRDDNAPEKLEVLGKATSLTNKKPPAT